MATRIVPAQLKVCPGQTTKYPPAVDSPFFWLRDTLPTDFTIIDFDGFSVSRGRQITKLLLLREFVTDSEQEIPSIDDLLRQVLQPQAVWDTRLILSKKLGVGIDIVFCPKNYPVVKRAGNPLIYVENVQSSVKPLSIFSMDILKLEEKIKSLRGFSFDLGRVKPVSAAKTCLECSLSLTGNSWPGDLDGVIFHQDQPLCTLEFKTHNLRTPINEEHIGKYGQQDWRRFEVQYNIKNALGGIPILFIVWGPNHREVKIDKITRPGVVEATNLVLKDSVTLTKTVLNMAKG